MYKYNTLKNYALLQDQTCVLRFACGQLTRRCFENLLVGVDPNTPQLTYEFYAQVAIQALKLGANPKDLRNDCSKISEPRSVYSYLQYAAFHDLLSSDVYYRRNMGRRGQEEPSLEQKRRWWESKNRLDAIKSVLREMLKRVSTIDDVEVKSTPMSMKLTKKRGAGPFSWGVYAEESPFRLLCGSTLIVKNSCA